MHGQVQFVLGLPEQLRDLKPAFDPLPEHAGGADFLPHFFRPAPAFQLRAKLIEHLQGAAVRFKLRHVHMGREIGNGEKDPAWLKPGDQAVDSIRVLREEPVEHQGQADCCSAGLDIFRNVNRGLVSAVPPDDLIMVRGVSVDGDAEVTVAAVHIGLQHGVPVFPVQQGNAAGHAVVVVGNVLGRSSAPDDGFNLRMVHGFIVHGEAGFTGQEGCQGVQLFNAQKRQLRGHHGSRAAVHIAVPAAGIAPGNQKIKINGHSTP